MTATVELRMPLGYVEMDAEEMEYLDGGAWGEWQIGYLNKDTCKKICRVYQLGAAASSLTALLSGAIGAVPATLIGAVLAIKCTTRSWFWEDAAAKNGVSVMFSLWRGIYFRQC